MLPETAPLLRGAEERVELARRDSYPGLEASCAHQVPPLPAVGAGRPAMKLEDGCVCDLVAEDFVKQVHTGDQK